MAILGIDEVGRGPMAGPLVVGAVILPEDAEYYDWYYDLRDSKKIMPKKRARIAAEVKEMCTTGLGWVGAGEIDEMGMTEALKLATCRAVKSVQQLHVPFSQIVIDGDMNFLEGTRLEKYTSTVVKGDNLIKEISAASIVAKVARDNYMCEIALEYPEYGFERHMGYGTDLHRAMIWEHGLCPEHRRLIKLVREIAIRDGENVKKVWKKTAKKNTSKVGMRGETAVCAYLENRGHTILMRNFKTKYCEIDIISVEGNEIYFTEVKYRRSDVAGGGMAAVNQRKLAKMKFAAECFMQFRRDLAFRYDPVLAVAEVTGEDFAVKNWLPLT